MKKCRQHLRDFSSVFLSILEGYLKKMWRNVFCPQDFYVFLKVSVGVSSFLLPLSSTTVFYGKYSSPLKKKIICMGKKRRNVIFAEKLFFWEKKKVLPTKKSVGGTFLSFYGKKSFWAKTWVRHFRFSLSIFLLLGKSCIFELKEKTSFFI